MAVALHNTSLKQKKEKQGCPTTENCFSGKSLQKQMRFEHDLSKPYNPLCDTSLLNYSVYYTVSSKQS